MLSRRIAPQLKRSVQPFARAASISAPKADTTKTSVPEKKLETTTPPTAWQAPNFPSTWSTSQKPRPGPASSPRFEQTNMDTQPQPLSAMELIAREPIRLTQGRKAICDGGGGPLGHPKVYINLDQPGPRACGYWCVNPGSIHSHLLLIATPGYSGIRFEQEPHHHH